MVCFLPVHEVWRIAEVSSVSPSSEQIEGLWGNQCLNSW